MPDMHFTVAEAVQHGIRLMKGSRRCTASTSRTATSSRRTFTSGVTAACAFSTSASRQSRKTIVAIGNPGTPSYMAPELFAGEQAGTAHDLYAAGVTLYHLLTRKYPYGEIEPFQHPKFGEPVAPTRYRPDIPGWLENVLLKAVAKDPAQRFETAEEFLLALERGATRPLNRPPVTPLATAQPAADLADHRRRLAVRQSADADAADTLSTLAMRRCGWRPQSIDPWVAGIASFRRLFADRGRPVWVALTRANREIFPC
jgi:serine/threonine protein kinase